MKISFFISVLLAVALTSCDCMQFIEGQATEIDPRTNQKVAIPGVIVRDTLCDIDLINDSLGLNLTVTSSNGVYRVSKMSEGVLGCPEITLYFYKEGYVMTKIVEESFTPSKEVPMVRAR